MNWNKVLNIFIIVFLVINIFIYGVNNYLNTSRHQISSEREAQLRAVLYKNGISADAFLLDYTPRKALKLYEPNVDRLPIINAMFGDSPYEVEVSELSEKYITKDQEITFYGANYTGDVSYEGTVSYKGYNEKYVPKEFEREEVIRVAEAFATDFTLDNISLKLITEKHDNYDEYYILEFNEIYDDEILFCSYVRVKVTENGVEEAKAEIYTPSDYIGQQNALYPIDEVLYKFINEVELSNNEMARITDLQIGYDVVIDDIRGDVFSSAIPYYRITISNKDVYYIDAYENEMVIFD